MKLYAKKKVKTFLGTILFDSEIQNPFDIDDVLGNKYISNFPDIYVEYKEVIPIIIEETISDIEQIKIEMLNWSFEELKDKFSSEEYKKLGIVIDKRIKKKEALILSILEQL